MLSHQTSIDKADLQIVNVALFSLFVMLWYQTNYFYHLELVPSFYLYCSLSRETSNCDNVLWLFLLLYYLHFLAINLIICLLSLYIIFILWIKNRSKMDEFHRKYIENCHISNSSLNWNPISKSDFELS